MFPLHIQKFISTYQIFGIFPLDKVLHILVGMIVTIFLRYLHVKMRYVFTILITLELIKEVFDSKTITNTITENILDFIATLSFPVLLLLVKKIKSHLDHHNEAPPL